MLTHEASIRPHLHFCLLLLTKSSLLERGLVGFPLDLLGPLLSGAELDFLWLILLRFRSASRLWPLFLLFLLGCLQFKYVGLEPPLFVIRSLLATVGSGVLLLFGLLISGLLLLH